MRARAVAQSCRLPTGAGQRAGLAAGTDSSQGGGLHAQESHHERREHAQAAQQALDPPADDPAAAAWTQLRAEAVRSTLTQLSEAQRHALALAYFGGYTQREIAQLTGIPLGTVKTRRVRRHAAAAAASFRSRRAAGGGDFMTDQVPDDHGDFEELTDGHVLHALEYEDEQRLLRHAGQCSRCQQTVAEFRAVAATLAQTAPPAEPSARLGERIMAVARADLAEPGRAAALSGPSSTTPAPPG